MRSFNKITSFLLAALIITICFSSCMIQKNSFSVNIFYKDRKSNYGKYSALYNNLVLFQRKHQMYSINTLNNYVKKVGNLNSDLVFFGADGDNLYFHNNQKKLKFYSSDLDLKSISLIGKYDYGHNVGSRIASRSFCVQNGNIFDISGELHILKNDSFIFPSIKCYKTITAPDNSFTLSLSEKYLFINADLHNLSGMFNIEENIFIPYNQLGAYPYILSYDKIKDQISLVTNNSLILLSNSKIEKQIKLKDSDKLCLYADDSDNFYFVAGSISNKETIYKVNKSNYNCEIINQRCLNIIALTSNYYLIYKNGYIIKYDISDNTIITKEKIFDGKEESGTNIDFELSGKYLLINKSNFDINVYDIGSMKRIF